ncbi:MarP family serine protease [Microbacterium terricola]|uniref:Colicin V production protein n=1 Tax=Microbacterium terricola TaxID=344163 RepID=A0ABM8DZK0_9MICO|nr:MarP family serine protease [Microbacterium terricola]UYK41197.1 MarP family serine protease [Microbacterium terricola]BDV31029.1 hypothetical protein Microterr_16890 [Microbacterium terricola]
MLVVDIVLLAVLGIALLIGVQRGLLASAGSLIGLVAGGAAAFWLVPVVNDAWPWLEWRMPVVLLVAVVLVLGGAAIGGAIGAALRRGVDRTPLRGLDRLLGGVVSVVVAALALSLAASSLVATGAPGVSAAVGSSQVLRTIDRLTPPPVSETLARLRASVMVDGLPRLDDLFGLGGLGGLGGAAIAPSVDLDVPELALAAASVARISGTAYSCGTSSSGTGFVIATDRLVTNAHVVAGVATPLVELPGTSAREGRIVYFDPIDDLAVIAVDDLGASPLPLGPTIDSGATGAVQGYPYGGPFTMVGAEVLSEGSAPIPDIYDESTALRDIYALAATVQPGNSGGPLLTGDGVVAGVVFARSDSDENLGYAMTMAELAPVAAQATSLDRSVSTGACTG